MDIKIDRASPVCRACSRQFKDAETLVTALMQKPGEGKDGAPLFERHDICNACWPKQDEARFRCHWTNEYSAKRRSPLLDAGVLWQVFHKSHPRAVNYGSPSLTPEEAAAAREAAEFTYIAAWALVRLKQLALEDTVRKGEREVYLFRTKGKKRDNFEVLDPKLDESGIERVQEKLSEFEPSDDAETQDAAAE